MDRINVPEIFSKLSHTPPSIKQNEWVTLYNPFYYDLSATRVTINREWAEARGITLNWLAQSIDGTMRLILGVEADNAGNFLDFANRFAVGHNLTAQDAASLFLLGHPTLAHIGTGLPRGDELNTDEVEAYVGDLANYTGVIGGELWFEHDSWWISDNSGRYGSHRQQTGASGRAAFRTMALESVQKKFFECADIDVGIYDA